MTEKGYDKNKNGIKITNDEFVVYEPHRIKKWIVCYPSDYKVEEDFDNF